MSTTLNPTLPKTASTSPLEVVSRFIGGQSVKSKSGRFGQVYNPALGKVARRVSFASKAEVTVQSRSQPRRFPPGLLSRP